MSSSAPSKRAGADAVTRIARIFWGRRGAGVSLGAAGGGSGSSIGRVPSVGSTRDVGSCRAVGAVSVRVEDRVGSRRPIAGVSKSASSSNSTRRVSGASSASTSSASKLGSMRRSARESARNSDSPVSTVVIVVERDHSFGLEALGAAREDGGTPRGFGLAPPLPAGTHAPQVQAGDEQHPGDEQDPAQFVHRVAGFLA